MEIDIEVTKKGYPALWEWGGGSSNTGKAEIITGREFERLKPVYIRQKGHLANTAHALFIVDKGYHIIRAWHHREDFEITIYKILDFDIENKKATVRVINKFDNGEWDDEINVPSAVEVVKKKATDYHCRSPYFYI